MTSPIDIASGGRQAYRTATAAVETIADPTTIIRMATFRETLSLAAPAHPGYIRPLYAALEEHACGGGTVRRLVTINANHSMTESVLWPKSGSDSVTSSRS